MRGASEAQIQKLEHIAGLRMSDGHREFLRAMGMTPARVLNPFLNDRDFCIDTLIEQFEINRREKISLPPGVAYFSSSDITGSNIFLRLGADPKDDPEIGDLHPETNELVLFDAGHFESFLGWHAFHFRENQFDHELHARPRWNPERERWEGDPSRCRDWLTAQGFELVVSVGHNAECYEHGGVAISLFHDGSMSFTGDDFDELVKRARSMPPDIKLEIETVPSAGRLRAPRE